jgi:hypothetical protein
MTRRPGLAGDIGVWSGAFVAAMAILSLALRVAESWAGDPAADAQQITSLGIFGAAALGFLAVGVIAIILALCNGWGAELRELAREVWGGVLGLLPRVRVRRGRA